jgi:hypothetical protein
MRREVYATYIQALEAFIQLGSTRVLETAEQRQELIEEEGVPALKAQAAAEIVAGEDVRKAVKAIDEAFKRPTGFKDEAEWLDLRKDFIDQAHNELFPDE